MENESIEIVQTNSPELASRTKRLFGVLIDIILIILILSPVAYFSGAFDNFNANPEQQPSLIYILVMTSLNIIVYTAINWKYLKLNGQTVGKMIVGTKIVSLNGNLVKPQEIIIKRYLPFILIPLIPVVGSVVSLVSSLLVFGKERRCLHDRIASTKVIECPKE